MIKNEVKILLFTMKYMKTMKGRAKPVIVLLQRLYVLQVIDDFTLNRTLLLLYLRYIYPTEPSKLMPNRACASTANSIGNSLNTSLQKPLTIIDTASSAERPRC